MASKNDLDFFYKLKSEDFNVFWTGGEAKPEYENIKNFFYNTIEKQSEEQARKIYIIENNEGAAVGHLYIIPNGEEFRLSCAIRGETGKGYAKKAIKLGLQEAKKQGFKRMVGSIREDNIASMKAYAACGVTITDEFYNEYIPKLGKKVKMFKTVYEF